MRTERLPRPFATTGLTWLAMLGVDLFLHAGLLAPLYDWDSPFLLAPEAAFVRIPAGYLAFLFLAAGLVWLLPRLGVAGSRDGALIAGALGAVVWGALVLGVWSISTAEPALLVGWWLGQSVELALAGAIVGSVLGGRDSAPLPGGCWHSLSSWRSRPWCSSRADTPLRLFWCGDDPPML